MKTIEMANRLQRLARSLNQTSRVNDRIVMSKTMKLQLFLMQFAFSCALLRLSAMIQETRITKATRVPVLQDHNLSIFVSVRSQADPSLIFTISRYDDDSEKVVGFVRVRLGALR